MVIGKARLFFQNLILITIITESIQSIVHSNDGKDANLLLRGRRRTRTTQEIDNNANIITLRKIHKVKSSEKSKKSKKHKSSKSPKSFKSSKSPKKSHKSGKGGSKGGSKGGGKGGGKGSGGNVITFDCSGAGNGYCENEYNIQQCNFDGGDCDEFNQLYPNCKVPDPSHIGDGLCDNSEPYFTEECGMDGGDCDDYPVDCDAQDTYVIGDGYCNIEYNTTKCDFDGGDCLDDEEPYYYD